MIQRETDQTLYPQSIFDAWNQQAIIEMPFHADDHCKFRVQGLDYGYDVAELVCVEGTYEGDRQSVSFAILARLLNGEPLQDAVYRYVNRWFDEQGVPHYHGVYSKYATIEEAQRNIVFNLLDVPVDLVYQAIDEDDMSAYLHDVNRNPDSDEISDIGTL